MTGGAKKAIVAHGKTAPNYFTSLVFEKGATPGNGCAVLLVDHSPGLQVLTEIGAYATVIGSDLLDGNVIGYFPEQRIGDEHWELVLHEKIMHGEARRRFGRQLMFGRGPVLVVAVTTHNLMDEASAQRIACRGLTEARCCRNCNHWVQGAESRRGAWKSWGVCRRDEPLPALALTVCADWESPDETSEEKEFLALAGKAPVRPR